jgi:hypothetical protein
MGHNEVQLSQGSRMTDLVEQQDRDLAETINQLSATASTKHYEARSNKRGK